jgi:hypothetical protein
MAMTMTMTMTMITITLLMAMATTAIPPRGPGTPLKRTMAMFIPMLTPMRTPTA